LNTVLKRIKMKPSILLFVAVIIIVAYTTKDPEAVAKACQLLGPMLQDMSQGFDSIFDWTANAA
jgi:hypothetical protein